MYAVLKCKITGYRYNYTEARDGDTGTNSVTDTDTITLRLKTEIQLQTQSTDTEWTTLRRILQGIHLLRYRYGSTDTSTAERERQILRLPQDCPYRSHRGMALAVGLGWLTGVMARLAERLIIL